MLMLGSGVVPAAGVPITSGHAGHWFAPDRSGEGWVLEMRSADSAWLYWFTYDETGGQRWMTATGQVTDDGEGGQRIEFPQLVVTRGARFGADFDPDDVVRELAGSASIEFSSCDEGRFSYEAFGQAQAFEVRRLARVMGSRCETPHGVTGREVADHAGQTGSWYDPSHNGEGLAVHWATPTQAIVTWYSYDSEGRQYWMLGTGGLDGEGRLAIDDLHATRGARFGAAFDPDEVERFAWGTLDFGLQCGAGNARYASVIPAFGEGSFDLQRLTALHEVACPWQAPTLQDLYDVEQFEVPPLDDPNSAGVLMDVLVNGGKVLGLDLARPRLYSWQPGDASLTLEDDDLPDSAPVFHPNIQRGALVSSDDAAVLAITSGPGFQSVPFLHRGDGWSLLPDLPEGVRLYTGNISANGEWIVGGQPGAISSRGWIWGASEGFSFVLPLRDADAQQLSRSNWRPLHVAKDGQIVVGHGEVPGLFMGSSTPAHAVRWRKPEAPELLRDGEGRLLDLPGAASDDGRIVFGAGRERGNPLHPDWGHPWYWMDGGQVGWLGRDLDGAGTGEWRYCMPHDTNADGSVLVGLCSRSDGGSLGRAFVWTPHTGLVSLPVDGDSDRLAIYTTARVSADGRDILVVDRVNEAPAQWRSRLIRLRPREFAGAP